MYRFEQGFENGFCRPNDFFDELGHPLLVQEGSTSNFGGVSNSLPVSDQWSSADTVAKLESFYLYGGQDGGQILHTGAVADHQLFDNHMSCSYQTTDDQQYPTYALQMKTEQRLMSETSHDSGTVSDSTYTSCRTLSSFAEHGDYESAEDFNDVFEGISSPRLPELHRYQYHPHAVNVAASHTSAEIIPSVTDHQPDEDVDALRPAVGRSAKPWTNIVRLVCACNRFKVLSKRGRRGKRKRSNEESNKHSCEIRISKKIPRDGKYLKEKAWIGTFSTPAQKERALDVGKYFLSTKRRKNFSDPNSEVTLAAFKGRLQGLPLTELVENVTRLAKYYAETGSLPQSLVDL